jgi:carbon storage regulator
VGETIVIGEDVQVTVVAVQGKKVRLAISAPPTIAVDRQEVRQRQAEFHDFHDDAVLAR